MTDRRPSTGPSAGPDPNTGPRPGTSRGPGPGTPRPPKPGRRRRRRAQSEVLGYVVMLAVALAVVSVTVAFGVTALQDAQQATIADSGEFAMQSIGSDLDALYHGTRATTRTEVGLSSASLETGATATVTLETVNYTGTASPAIDSRDYPFQPVVYSSGDTDVVYENSLVVRDQRDGAVAVTDSLFVLSEDRAVIPVVQTRTGAPRSIGGSDVATVAAALNGNRTGATTVTNRSASGEYVHVVFSVDTVEDRATVWNRTLSEQVTAIEDPGGTPTCARSGSTVTCDFNTSTVVVSRAWIDYELE